MSKLRRILISFLLVLVTVQCLSQEADTKLLVAIDGVLFKPFTIHTGGILYTWR